LGELRLRVMRIASISSPGVLGERVFGPFALKHLLTALPASFATFHAWRTGSPGAVIIAAALWLASLLALIPPRGFPPEAQILASISYLVDKIFPSTRGRRVAKP
jgi:hypothetical protein